MKYINKIMRPNLMRFKIMVLILLFNSIVGCESYLEVDYPESELAAAEVFTDEATATAALTDVYAKLRDQVLLTGNSSGLSVLMSLYADELDYFGAAGQPQQFFFNHNIVPVDVNISSTWSGAYNLIYAVNSIKEGVTDNPFLDSSQQEQLLGEALFLRAFVHFQLVSLFGDIPYITTTDYLINSTVKRMSKEEVYDLIITDLTEAESLLPETYVSGERTRANKFTAMALMARVYLYMENWEKAEEQSNGVINGPFLWEEDISKIFLKDCTTSIFQLKPKAEGHNTEEAISFIFTSAPPPAYALSEPLIQDFELGDLRWEKWVGAVSDGSKIYYHPYKYKVVDIFGSTVEYSTIFRLAEQYLIRAEARVKLGNISGALEDLNRIRNRAGLANNTEEDEESLILAIFQERRIELFTELGQRWFDLKRSGKAEEALSGIKPGWRSTDVLLPIPEAELMLNPNLEPQNPGY